MKDDRYVSRDEVPLSLDDDEYNDGHPPGLLPAV